MLYMLSIYLILYNKIYIIPFKNSGYFNIIQFIDKIIFIIRIH